jgi:hypothetical protein
MKDKLKKDLLSFGRLLRFDNVETEDKCRRSVGQLRQSLTKISRLI